MSLDDFLSTTTQRLPTAPEIVSLCRDMGIQFVMKDGKPVLRGVIDDRDVRLLIAKVIGREPWRSQIIEMTMQDQPEEIDEERRKMIDFLNS